MSGLLPSAGRPGVVLLMTVKRQLTSDDIFRLATEAAPKSSPPAIQRLKARHHAAARFLAAGRKINEVADLVGYTPQRIGDMNRTDPAFINLVAYYRTQIDEITVDARAKAEAKLALIAETASDILLERLETKEDEIPIGEIRQIAAFGYDRSTAPPKTAVSVQQPPANITFNIGNRDLKPKTPGDDAKDITPKTPTPETVDGK